MRIIFCGTGEIGLPSLEFLLGKSSGHEVVAVLCQPDKPVGRKQLLTPPATKELALRHDIPVHQPHKIRHAADLVTSLRADLMVVMAYGQILPQAILDIPRLGCINLHASLLPRHRGAAPIQSAILAGDPHSGVTAMYMDAGLDTGDILCIEPLDLAPDETGGSLHDRLAQLAPLALAKALHLLTTGSAPRIPQDPALVTHIGKLFREDGKVNWSLPADTIARRIRAFDPWPGSYTSLPAGGRQLKLYPPVQAEAITTGCAPPGSVLAAGPEGLLIACGEGALRLTQVQEEGRKKMPVSAYLLGATMASGAILG